MWGTDLNDSSAASHFKDLSGALRPIWQGQVDDLEYGYLGCLCHGQRIGTDFIVSRVFNIIYWQP